jgi:hypothetical protein
MTEDYKMDIKTAIREVGGIVHGDGNIFFTDSNHFMKAALKLLDTSDTAAGSFTIFLDGDTIDVSQFYRAKGFECLPPTVTMTGAEIRACGWKKNDYLMYIDYGDGIPFKPVGDTTAIVLENGMRFVCVPRACADLDIETSATAAELDLIAAEDALGGVLALGALTDKESADPLSADLAVGWNAPAAAPTDAPSNIKIKVEDCTLIAWDSNLLDGEYYCIPVKS